MQNDLGGFRPSHRVFRGGHFVRGASRGRGGSRGGYRGGSHNGAPFIQKAFQPKVCTKFQSKGCKDEKCANYHPRVVCKYLFHGNCTKGENCTFSHNLKETALSSHFREGCHICENVSLQPNGDKIYKDAINRHCSVSWKKCKCYDCIRYLLDNHEKASEQKRGQKGEKCDCWDCISDKPPKFHLSGDCDCKKSRCVEFRKVLEHVREKWMNCPCVDCLAYRTDLVCKCLSCEFHRRKKVCDCKTCESHRKTRIHQFDTDCSCVKCKDLMIKFEKDVTYKVDRKDYACFDWISDFFKEFDTKNFEENPGMPKLSFPLPIVSEILKYVCDITSKNMKDLQKEEQAWSKCEHCNTNKLFRMKIFSGTSCFHCHGTGNLCNLYDFENYKSITLCQKCLFKKGLTTHLSPEDPKHAIIKPQEYVEIFGDSIAHNLYGDFFEHDYDNDFIVPNGYRDGDCLGCLAKKRFNLTPISETNFKTGDEVSQMVKDGKGYDKFCVFDLSRKIFEAKEDIDVKSFCESVDPDFKNIYEKTMLTHARSATDCYRCYRHRNICNVCKDANKYVITRTEIVSNRVVEVILCDPRHSNCWKLFYEKQPYIEELQRASKINTICSCDKYY